MIQNHISAAEYRELLAAKNKKSKYRAQKVTVDGKVFDSRKEGNRYSELSLLERAGEISGLVLQPKYLLQPAYVKKTGEKVRAMYYKADFEYVEKTGRVIIEDTKGFQTRVFKNKQKMFEFLYPDKELRLL